MKLNTWQWIGLAILIVCLGLYLFRQFMTTPQGTPTPQPPAPTQPAATQPAK